MRSTRDCMLNFFTWYTCTLLNSTIKLPIMVRAQLLNSDTNLRYIVDGASPYLQLEVAQSIVAHSPDTSKYKDYLKLSDASNAPLYMPHWDKDELESVRVELYQDVTRQQVCLSIFEPWPCVSSWPSSLHCSAC